MGEKRIVLRYTEEEITGEEEAGFLAGLKAVTFLPMMSDELFVQVLGMLSKYAAGVSIWDNKLVIPKTDATTELAKQHTKPPDGELN